MDLNNFPAAAGIPECPDDQDQRRSLLVFRWPSGTEMGGSPTTFVSKLRDMVTESGLDATQCYIATDGIDNDAQEIDPGISGTLQELFDALDTEGGLDS